MHTRTEETSSSQDLRLFDFKNRVGSSIEKEIERKKLHNILRISDHEILAAAITTVRAVSFEPIRDLIRYLAYRHTLYPAEKKAWQDLARHAQHHHERDLYRLEEEIQSQLNQIFIGKDKCADHFDKKDNANLPIALLGPSIKAFKPNEKGVTEFMRPELMYALRRYMTNLIRPLSDSYLNSMQGQAKQGSIPID